MGAASSFALYGLCVRSELSLAAPAALATQAADFTVAWGAALPEDTSAPAGETWASADFGNGAGVRLTKTDAGWSLFYLRTGEFRFGPDLLHATAHAVPGREAMLPLLLAGSVPSWVLAMRGEPLLHASAVAVQGRAIAFIGASGMGKSTLAALLCSAGARMVTDDVLRLDRREGEFLCHFGSGEIRLREGAAALAASFPSAASSRSADNRITLQPPSPASRPSLGALVIPHPSRTLDRLSLERLSVVEASFLLNGYTRVYGWRQDAPLRRQFVLFAELAAKVPVFRAHIPWGPPFAPDLAGRLAAACGVPF